MYSGVYDKRGGFVRWVYLFMALSLYVLTLGNRGAKKKRIVLCYHGILPGQQEQFAWQVRTISKRKSQNIRLTFDDAFANLLDHAVPILEAYGVRGTLFAVVNNLGQRPGWKMPEGHPESCETIIDAERLILLSKHPLIGIGSHTMTHPDLARIPSEEAEQELVQSRRQLETLLGCPVEDLALPYGSYTNAVLAIAKEEGYKRIYTLQPKLVSEAEFSEGVLGRFLMSPDVWKIEFLLTCAGAYSWLAWWRPMILRIRRPLQ